ncbi:hypothetical protein DFH07DRAFT_480906 [Mycena maculata]|uniref:Uncharacterized protein n=1 Tax=Mycena maculata TaxID=230809 RepID=A0AAD7NDU5_9AGAR|nr:hypothetical protein DFH07DRAFT_480906 [Mycena maculata]
MMWRHFFSVDCTLSAKYGIIYGFLLSYASTKPFPLVYPVSLPHGYNDSVDGGWVIGYHPESEDSLMFALVEAFLAVIGRLVADAIEGKLSADLTGKFAVTRIPDQSRRAKSHKS